MLSADNNNNGEYDSGDDLVQDYNGDGVISVAYEFEDRGNNVWDPEEPYYDIDSSGTYDLNEPYQDRNCNFGLDMVHLSHMFLMNQYHNKVPPDPIHYFLYLQIHMQQI